MKKMRYNIATKWMRSGAGMVRCALCVALLTACTDTWDDHYEAGLLNDVHNGTLWQAITQDEELSNFKRVVEATGYQTQLGSSQVFTVFAPTNSHFSAAQADSVIALYMTEKYKAETLAEAQALAAAGSRDTLKDKENRAIKEFVQNHITLYTRSVSSLTDDSILMMNGKYAVLKSDGISNSAFAGKTNTLYENGVLFKVQTPLDYVPNLFEKIRDLAQFDSLAQFLYSYNEDLFSAASSVEGDIDSLGRTVYLDSVVYVYNKILYNIGRLDKEDSTYWMLAPTNDMWNKMVDEYSQYYVYSDSVSKSLRDSFQYYNPRFAIVEGTVFSMTTNMRNGVVNRDSAVSVNAINANRRKAVYGNADLHYYQYDNPFDEGGVYDGVTMMACSNGQLMEPQQWNIKPTETFLRMKYVEGENNNWSWYDNRVTKMPVTREVPSTNPFYNKLSNNAFVEIEGTTADASPDVVFPLGGLLSNVGYDIYLVAAPAIAYTPDSLTKDKDRLPMQFRAVLSYRNEKGDSTVYSGLSVDTRGRDRAYVDLTSRADVLDTIVVGTNLKFPTASVGLSDERQYPKLRITSRVRDSKAYSSTLRIDAIIVKPHEEEATESEEE